MATAEIADTAATAAEKPPARPLTVAASLANHLWQALRDAHVESDAAAEQLTLEELLENVAAIERRLYRLSSCPVLHPNASHPQPRKSPPNRPR